MTTIQNLYPDSPLNVPAAFTEASPSFKAEVKKVMGSITFFFIVYILLIIFSIALGIGCVFAGIAVMAGLASLIGLMLGLGIISIGIMVFIFLVKFIFSVKKFDESGSLEITAAEQPQLFDFIKKLTTDTQTQFPKKIILSPEVNACVFYNDSFWSMFFPVKKNLQIGLGLVNTLTLSEFKAVMAHEFGHFSQRSMKLGTFVYNVNKAIYNMLYENKDYGNFLQRWGNVHWAIGIFMWVTIQIVKIIQEILQSVYGFINKRYMSLSREMEFHADAVAASVSGSNNLIQSLRKIEISDFCYSSVLRSANERIEDKSVFDNIYTKHLIVMEQYGKENNLVLENSVPVTDESFLKKFQASRVNIINQWASHPSREDREARLRELNINAEEDSQPAWILFNGPLQLQQQLTDTVYRNVSKDIKQKTINDDDFRNQYSAEMNSHRLPEEYNGYFDGHFITDIDVNAVLAIPYVNEVNRSGLQRLVSDEKVALPKLLVSNNNDAELLKKIVNKEITTKTFDFDGEKYKKEYATILLDQLKKETDQQTAAVQENDESIIAFFYKAAQQKGYGEAETLRKLYLDYFEDKKLGDLQLGVSQRIMNILLPLLHGHNLTMEKAIEIASGLRGESRTLQDYFTKWMQRNAFDQNPQFKERARLFLHKDYQYFSENRFFNNELEDIHYFIHSGLAEINKFQSTSFKKILEYQLSLL
ncbi:MAG: M48 family metallopeptidase [Chitinophagaceae bacterium]